MIQMSAGSSTNATRLLKLLVNPPKERAWQMPQSEGAYNLIDSTVTVKYAEKITM